MLAESLTVNEIVSNPVSCPRCDMDVYFLGIFIEDYLVNTLMESARYNRNPHNIFENLAENHMTRRDKMRELANSCINRSLVYFYAEGGPIIEPPISEQYIMKVTPSFNKIIVKFFGYLNTTLDIISKVNNTGRIERDLTQYIIEMFAKLSCLYQEAEINEAFADLIRVENTTLRQLL